jgi:hypothetical protein
MVLSATLALTKPYFCSLDFGESFGFCWVFFPGLSFYKLLQGCSCAQSNLGGRFEISPVSLLLHELGEGHKVLHVLFPVHSVAQESLLGFSFGRLDLNSFPKSTYKQTILGHCIRGGRLLSDLSFLAVRVIQFVGPRGGTHTQQ